MSLASTDTEVDWAQRARHAAALAQAADAQIEAARQLPAALAQELAALGLNGLLTPRAYGGHEVPPTTYLEIIETLAERQSSAAWCSFIGSTSALLSAYLAPDVAQTMFGRGPVIAAGVFAPRGQARRVQRDGVAGLNICGHWPWGSGGRNAQWVSGGCMVIGADGKPETLADGTPQVWSAWFSADQVQWHDTWHVMGLRGTGSHDFSVQDAFVPLSRCVCLMTDAPQGDAAQSPLYRLPAFGLLALGIAAVALGVARRAQDELLALAGGKTPQGSARPLALHPRTQEDVARAHARWHAARGWLHQVTQAAWLDAQSPAESLGAQTTARRRDLRLACSHAVAECVAITDAMHRLAGGTAVYECCPITRCMRDIHVVSQHMMVASSTFELTGRLLLDVPTPLHQL
jgi:indole-3-acetate monooxygenase